MIKYTMRSSTLVAMAVTFLAMALALDLSFALKREDDSDLRLPRQGYDLEVGGKGEGGEEGKPWTCCNACQCTRSLPAKCRCMDRVQDACHQDCKDCVQVPVRIFPPLFQCRDVVQGGCGSRCTPE